MDKNPLLSIVIPCYNDAKFVKQSVDSALNQTYENKEIILVDDGSDALTKEVLKKIEPKVNQLITQENKGQSAARNKGVALSKGEYILILDSDDYFEPTFAQKAIKAFSLNSNAKIVSCYTNLIYEDKFIKVYKPPGGKLKDFLINNSVIGTSMFKKADWQSVKGYDESMRSGFEDWEFFIRLLKNGGEALVIKEPLFNYRKRMVSTTSRANKKKYELLKYIHKKNKDVYIENYDFVSNYLISQIEREAQEKLKNINSIEYKIGSIILKPVRWIKGLIK